MKLGRLLTPDDWNAHNAKLVIHPAGWFDEKWSAPTEVIRICSHPRWRGEFKGGPKWFPNRSIGYGDKISCIIKNHGSIVVASKAGDILLGERLTASRANEYNSEQSNAGDNVCRPFDEAHMVEGWRRVWESVSTMPPEVAQLFPSGWARINIANGGGKDPIHADRHKAVKVSPRNHGAGSPCVCLKTSAKRILKKPPAGEVVGTQTKDGLVRLVWHNAETQASALRMIVERPCSAVFANTGREALELWKRGEFLTLTRDRRDYEIVRISAKAFYELVSAPKKRCRWCNGTGRVDYDQCGRGDPSRHHTSKSMSKNVKPHELVDADAAFEEAYT